MQRQLKKIRVKNQQGVTLIELMVAVIIMGILASIAVPSFNTFLKNSRLTTQINYLVTAINLTRSEAIKRNSSVTVCKSNTGNTCAGNWTDGWIVFADENSDGAVDGGEAVIRVYGALKGGNTLNFGKNRITYSAEGIAIGFNSTFILCDDRDDSTDASHAKGIVTSNTGRARLAIDSDGDGTVEGGGGGNITCP